MVEIGSAGARRPLPVAAHSARRILVVAHQTATGAALVDELQRRASHGTVRVHLVVPALNGRLRHWLSDIDDAHTEACHKAEAAVALLTSRGVAITAEVGDSVPLLAIEDALAEFAADEILISTLPAARSHWSEHNLVDRALERFSVPVAQVVAEETVPRSAHTAVRFRGGGPLVAPAERRRARRASGRSARAARGSR